nr:9027_t:CDS:2 [Entrophospora candida]
MLYVIINLPLKIKCWKTLSSNTQNDSPPSSTSISVFLLNTQVMIEVATAHTYTSIKNKISSSSS